MKTILAQANAIYIPLPDQSVHCIVTSPPYWGLRDYGLPGTVWPSVNYAPLPGLGPVTAGIWRGCYGLEPTIDLYVAHTVLVFREVWRVLRDDGVLWLNLGDSYIGGGYGGWENGETGRGLRAQPGQKCHGKDKRSPPPGLKAKDLAAIPWRVALALQADGWYLRSDVIWHKTNCLPESVTDRPTKAHEYVFLLAKSARYFYDADAIREKSIDPPGHSRGGSLSRQGNNPFISANAHKGPPAVSSGLRNRRTVWSIPTAAWPGAHFATFPPALVEPCIKAGTSEWGCCPACGAQWGRITEREFAPQNDVSRERGIRGATTQKPTGENSGWDGFPRGTTATTTTGWRPTCDHDVPPVPSLVLDPFAGSGTTLQVARALGRRSIGLDLSFAYLSEQARARLELDRLDEWENGKATEELSLDDLPLFVKP